MRARYRRRSSIWRRAAIDALESRWLLTGTPLIINGSSGDDVIQISVSGVSINVTINSSTTHYTASAYNSIQITPGQGNDTVYVYSNADKPVTIYAADGINYTDTVYVGNGNLDNITAPVNLASADDIDAIYLDDQSNSVGRSYLAGGASGETEVTWGSASGRVDCIPPGDPIIEAGQGNDTCDLAAGTGTPGSITFDGNGGDDTFRDGNFDHHLSSNGFAFFGGSGSNSLVMDDSASTGGGCDFNFGMIIGLATPAVFFQVQTATIYMGHAGSWQLDDSSEPGQTLNYIGNSGGDELGVYGANDSTTINFTGGNDNDIFRALPSSLYGWGANVTLNVNLGGGNDLAQINPDEPPGFEGLVSSLTVNVTGGDGTDTLTSSIGGEASVTLAGGDGNDVIQALSHFNPSQNAEELQTVTGLFDGGAGNDTIDIGAPDASFTGLEPSSHITVTGGAGNDVLNINNKTGGPYIYTLNNNVLGVRYASSSFPNPAFVSYDGTTEALNLYYIGDLNTFVFGASESEEPSVILLGVNNPGSGSLDGTTVPVDLIGSNNNAQYYDTLILDDQQSSYAGSYVINATSITRGSWAVMFDTTLDDFILNAAGGANTIQVNAAPGSGSYPTTINAGGGQDNIQFGLNGNTDGLAGGHFIVDGGGQSDYLTYDDSQNIRAGGASDVFSMTSTTLHHTISTGGKIATIDYANIAIYTIDAGRAGNASDEFDINSTPANAGVVELFGNIGGCAFFVGNGLTSGINCSLELLPSAGSGLVSVDDSLDTAGRTVHIGQFTIGASSGDNLFGVSGSLYLPNMSEIDLNTGSGADTIYAKPDASAFIFITASTPTNSPGDTLGLAFADALNPVFTPQGVGAGRYTFSNCQPVIYTGIETVQIDSTPPTATGAFFLNTTRQTLDFQFSETLGLTPSTFYLSLINTTTNQPVPADHITSQYDPASRTVHFTFPGYSNGVLPDANYEAKILGGLVDLFGNHMNTSAPFDFFMLMGDTNHDRHVNVADLADLAGNFGATSGATWASGDFDYNGNVNVADLADLAGNFGQSLGSIGAADTAAAIPAGAATAVPEPGSVMLALGGLSLAAVRRRARGRG
jgi:hypothetical protein